MKVIDIRFYFEELMRESLEERYFFQETQGDFAKEKLDSYQMAEVIQITDEAKKYKNEIRLKNTD